MSDITHPGKSYSIVRYFGVFSHFNTINFFKNSWIPFALNCPIHILILATLFSLTNLSFGQKQNNTWYFGDKAGLEFDGSSVNVLTNSAMTQIEGVATVSDKNGKLLFYTNGQEIYDATHNVMANGSGLKGHPSATQGSVIAPKPGSNSLFYVFTTGAVITRTNVFSAYYSVVDITGNGGKGAVVSGQKNVEIYSGTSEKCAAAYHCNGIGVWILFHDYPGANYRAYLLDKNGFNSSPVNSSIGLSYNSAWQKAGQLKFSHDGKRIANADRDEFINNSVAEVFDFDRSTGKVTKLVATLKTAELVHGIEFSPNDSLLYVASGTQTNAPIGTGKLHQFNLFAGSGSSSEIQNSAVLLNSQSNIWFGQLQLAVNQKIYLSPRAQSSLGVIANPNVKGTGCNFNLTGQSLGGRTSQLGLPNFISSINPVEFVDLEDTIRLCKGGSYTLDATTNGATYRWQDNSTQATMIVSNAGIYWVEVSLNGCKATESVVVEVNTDPPIVDLGPDSTYCFNDEIILHGKSTPGSSNQWQDNSTDSTFLVTKPGLYWVRVTENGCQSSDSVQIDFLSESVSVFIGNDSIYCDDSPVTLDAFTPGATYKWHDNSIFSTVTTSKPGTYWVEVSVFGCKSSDTIQLDFSSDWPSVDLGPNATFCNHSIVKLDATSPGATYLWQNKSTLPTYTVRVSGTYWVKVKTPCGVVADTIQIDFEDCVWNFWISSVFTPNGDNLNESFGPDISGLDGYDYQLMIFNRWGEKLFESTAKKMRWDGTYKGELVMQGSYLWTIKLTKNDLRKIDYGVVTLIR